VFKPVYWDASGAVYELPFWPGHGPVSNYDGRLAISGDNAVIAGGTFTDDGFRAVLWSGIDFADIFVLPAPDGDPFDGVYDRSVVSDMSDDGLTVIGYLYRGSGSVQYPCVWKYY
jgi:hypothetical protein